LGEAGEVSGQGHGQAGKMSTFGTGRVQLMRDLNHDGSGLRHWVSTSWREVVNARIVRWAVRLSSDVVGYLWGIRTEVCWWTGIVAVHRLAAQGL
jgi:hypothetical protein